MALQTKNSLTKALNKVQNAWNKINDGESDRHLVNLQKWYEYRVQTLLALRKFQDEFDKIHLYGSTVRTVGSGATLIGSLATVVGLGMSLSKDWRPIGKELMKYGSTIGSVGGATTITTSLVECGFNVRTLNEVKAALERDSRQTEELLHLFDRTKELDAHLREVFDCGIANISDILTAIREISVIYSKGGKALNNLRSYLSALISKNFSIKHLPKLDDKKLEAIIYHASYKVQLFLKEFCDNDLVRSASWTIYCSFKKNPISFDLSKISVRIMGKAVVQETAFLSFFASPDTRSLIRCVDLTARGLFRAINVALSIVAFLSAVDDVKNGKSKYSEMVEKTREFLLIELKEFESYPMFNNHV